MRNVRLLFVLLFACGWTQQANASAGTSFEGLRAGAESSFLRDLGGFRLQGAAPVPMPAQARTIAAVPRNGVGFYLNVTVEKRFQDEYEVRQGSDVQLVFRPRSPFPDRNQEYEGTGTLFGERLGFGNPLLIKNDVFGSRQTLLVKGAGMDLRFERLVGWGRMEVDASLGQAKPEAVALLLGLNLLPVGGFPAAGSPPSPPSAPAPAGEGFKAVFRQGFSGEFYVEGPDLNLTVRSSRAGFEDVEYEVTGSGFGRQFGFGQLTLRTDKTFLGLRGYRVRGPGIDLEVRDDNFAGRQRLELRGTPGDSAKLAAFLVSLARYLGR